MKMSLVRKRRSSCQIVVLFGVLAVMPVVAGAATVGYDNDTSSWYPSTNYYQVCDGTSGKGDAYGNWRVPGGSPIDWTRKGIHPAADTR